ncbi:unnamed protein product [Lactuca saligna]|uniref:Uncharacterized protein n=1 Tax=Lactuca saligna TaxID=75948 RepID=A0AA35Z2H0_LACSI|nr:unnamed protein product [Lactuca saligna]
MPSSEEVIRILDYNTPRSEGIIGAPKQPIINKGPIGIGPTEPPHVYRVLSHLGSDLDWVVKDGVVRNIEKIIELPNFFQGVGRIKNICFVAGYESGREALRKAVVVGTFNPSAASSTSSHSREMVEVFDSFISRDYASMMKLGSLDLDFLCQLCAYDDHGGVGPSSNAKIIGLDGGASK